MKKKKRSGKINSCRRTSISIIHTRGNVQPINPSFSVKQSVDLPRDLFSFFLALTQRRNRKYRVDLYDDRCTESQAVPVRKEKSRHERANFDSKLRYRSQVTRLSPLSPRRMTFVYCPGSVRSAEPASYDDPLLEFYGPVDVRQSLDTGVTPGNVQRQSYWLRSFYIENFVEKFRQNRWIAINVRCSTDEFLKNFVELNIWLNNRYIEKYLILFCSFLVLLIVYSFVFYMFLWDFLNRNLTSLINKNYSVKGFF